MTKRELEILSLIGKGMTNEEIATFLRISVNTVNRHRSNIRRINGITTNAMFYKLCAAVDHNSTAEFNAYQTNKANQPPAAILEQDDNIMDTLEYTPSTPLVLIVSEEKDAVKRYEPALKGNYELIVAESGHNAAKVIINEEKLDLILTDTSLSDLDGYKLFAIAKSIPKTRNTPFIFVTDSHNEEDEDLCLQCDSIDFIRKPIKDGILRAKVRTHIQNKQLRDEIQLQKSILSSELQRRMTEITHLQNMSLDALTELAKVRDNETGEHLIRTREYVRIIAEELLIKGYYTEELDKESISLIARSAPLHDIGKVGIPDRILLKPGKLTNGEWEIMKLHPVKGYEALQIAELRSPIPIPYIRYAKEIARHHHEKWNGSGYPDRLAGEDIPLSARIMSVADVFDALISKRVYKPAFDINYARESINALSEIEFDPKIVEAFNARFKEILEISVKYADNPDTN